jgi:hypothetical protein
VRRFTGNKSQDQQQHAHDERRRGAKLFHEGLLLWQQFYLAKFSLI